MIKIRKNSKEYKLIERLIYWTLEIADNAYNAFKEAYKNAMEVLNNVTETTENTYSALKSNIRDTIKERYPYC